MSLTTQAEQTSRWSRHYFYKMGDKPNTMLAQKLAPRVYASALSRLRLKHGQLTQNPQPVVRTFYDFYPSLYDKPDSFQEALEYTFFQDISLPQ